MAIPFIDLKAQYRALNPEINQRIARVLLISLSLYPELNVGPKRHIVDVIVVALEA